MQIIYHVAILLKEYTIQVNEWNNDLLSQLGALSYEKRIKKKTKISHEDFTNEEENMMATWPYGKWKQ